ncbi:hypothetical protein [Phenylobacterium montanum]|uniref:Uncharacterized protein n=1 Tax=Phenylobacterium montanum TaxID=2823693 RepID=A0A975IWI2_9CAUL|nr:hypothetical protein [Caulobacter sp. S6]QUD89865.1 hypothetical protein KCG34_08340 [Caulobacter sp. S6]
MSEARLIRAAETLAQTFELGGDEQVAALMRDGFDEGEAWRLVALLPIAFGRPVLEELGMRHFVQTVTAQAADGKLVQANLMRQPEYAAGLKLARAHRQYGVMDHEVYKLIAGSSADIDAASNALNQGADLTGATIASSLMGPEIARHLIR